MRTLPGTIAAAYAASIVVSVAIVVIIRSLGLE